MSKGKMFTNRDISKLLNNVAAVYEVLGENKFKIVAYQRAAVSVEHASSEIKDYWDDDKLKDIPGIGESIASYLDELFRTGKVKHFEELFGKVPQAMFVFLDIPGVGPKTAYFLAKNLKISSPVNAIKKLKQAAKQGLIRNFENFGEKSEKEILEGISSLEKGELKIVRMILPYATNLAEEIISYLKKSPLVEKADPLGSLRRKVSTIGDIDISLSTNSPQKVIEYLLKYGKIKRILDKGKKDLVRIILTSGQQVDIRFSEPDKYGSMLQYFTGSKQHNIELRNFALKKGMSLSEYGIKINQKSNIKDQKQVNKSFANEKDFYNELGLEWIPPELREGTDEIDASKTDKLPKLVELKDIKGDLHVHSNFDIESSHDLGGTEASTMVEEAIKLNYEYIGFSEHNPSNSKHKESEIIGLLKAKKNYIEQLISSINRNSNQRGNNIPIKVLNGLEVDIRSDGTLAIPEEGFNYLDYVIASVHSVFNLNREKMTKRIIAALSHPKVNILGHPTGRLLQEREGYELDWDKIFEFCLKNQKILEISAWPNRLDLPDQKVHEAIKYEVKVIINSDSHHVSQMSNMKYGVYVARRGWAEKKDIVNTLSYDQLVNLLKN